MKSITGVGVFTTSTTYDAADRVRSLTYPDGEVVTQTYSARGLPLAITGTLAGQQFSNYGYVGGTTYNVFGQMTTQAFGNGLSASYAYDPLNVRLRQIQVGYD